jgi:sulfatase maturation enzyme AslB (radical SAM superfamily)
LGYQSIFLNTNGLLLTSDIADRLARYPCLGVSVSLHGPEAIHDGMHAGGAYRRVTAGMRRALEAGLALTVFTIIGKTLLGQLPAFAVDLKEKFYGVERLTLIQLIGVKNDACDLSLELLDPEDFIKMVRTVSALNLCGFVTDVLNDPLVNVAAEMLGLPLVPRSRPLCRPGKLVVRANRDITLAHSTRENFGHYTPGMVAQVLADNRFREAVAPDDITCPACCYINHCRRNGMRRPSPGVMARQPEIPYCQSVLACIDPPV